MIISESTYPERHAKSGAMYCSNFQTGLVAVCIHVVNSMLVSMLVLVLIRTRSVYFIALLVTTLVILVSIFFESLLQACTRFAGCS